MIFRDQLPVLQQLAYLRQLHLLDRLFHGDAQTHLLLDLLKPLLGKLCGLVVVTLRRHAGVFVVRAARLRLFIDYYGLIISANC